MAKGGSAPQAPDPQKVAALQGAEDRKTLQYGLDNSRTTTVNPFGSTSWKNNKTFDQAGFDAAMKAYKPASEGSGTPHFIDDGQGGQIWGNDGHGTPASGTMPNRADFEGKDNWTNTQVLSPESQGIYDQATSKLKDAMGNISTNPGAYNQTVADAVFNRMRRYQDPLDAQARSSQQSNLADRGFAVGNEAYNTDVSRLQHDQSMGIADAADRAQVTGSSQGLAEQSMQQQIAQMLQGMRGAQVGGVSSMPSTTTTPSIQPVDIAGMTEKQYQDQLQSYNAQQASSNGMLGSLLSMGGMAMGMPGGLGGLLGKMGGSTPQPSYSNPSLNDMTFRYKR